MSDPHPPRDEAPPRGAYDAADGDVAAGQPGATPTDLGTASVDVERGRPGRSILAIALSETARRWGARIGGVWIAFLLFIAVCAPVLANSRPLLMRSADGTLSSPAWQALTVVDIALPLIAVGLVGMLVSARKLRWPALAATAAAVLVLAGSFGVGALVADPPLLERLEQYRDPALHEGNAWVVRAPIPFSPNDRLTDLGNARIAAPWWLPNEQAESLPTSHWLGTTVNGEDMASRMIHAARVALGIGIVATGISTAIGIAVGAVMGYFGGWVDLLGMRFIEILQALPSLVILLIVTSFFGRNIWLMMTAIGLISWTGDARFIRAEFLRLRGQDFVQAARAVGLPTTPILFRHMLPNGIAPVLVNASFGIASAILLESFLSFLGLGLAVKDPSWGQLLDQARQGATGFNWWIAIFPGLAIFLTVFAYILIGESLRDALDPKLKKLG